MNATAQEPGITVHFLGATSIHTSMSLTAAARSVGFGDEMILTAEVIEASRDNRGRCALLELLDDEDGQVRRWGRVIIRRGPWPEGVDRIEPGSHAWDDARRAALADAWSISDLGEQRAAVARVREKYGVDPSACSRTIAEYGPRR